MVSALAACGGGEKTNTDPVQVAPETSAAPDNQAADEKTLADADYEQLTQLMTATVSHEDMITQMGTLREQVGNGEATEDALLDAYKQLSDDSQLLLSSVQGAEWQTEQYAEHVALLTAAVEALAASELASYEASADNDESKLAEIEALTQTYTENMDALLELMGV
jgi:hypothetical protein